MNVRVQIVRLDAAGTPVETIEDYTVPPGTWLQTRTMGAQPVPAVLEPVAYRWPEVVQMGPLVSRATHAIVYEPLNPPYVPEDLLKLVNGQDKRWGRNGYEWIGRNQQRSGGTTLDRAKEFAAKYRFYVIGRDGEAQRAASWPVQLSGEEVAMILEESGVQMAGARKVAPIAAAQKGGAVVEELPLFAMLEAAGA